MPEANIVTVRREIFDPQIEDYVKEEVPTETIKRFNRIRGNTNTLIATYTGLGMRPRSEGGSFDATGRIIRLGLVADRAQEMGLIDRNGTFDIIYIAAAGRYDALGASHKPLYNVVGTVRIRALGSPSAGTFAASFEIKKHIPGTFTVS